MSFMNKDRRGKTCRGMEHELRSQTLKFLKTSRSLDPTSHSPMSPTLVPTAASQGEQSNVRRYEQKATKGQTNYQT